MRNDMLTRSELADLIERHAQTFVAALRDAALDEPGSGTTDEGAAITLDALAQRTFEWRKVGERDGETYTWPEGTEHYDPFEIWETLTDKGRTQLGVGRVAVSDKLYYGRPRGYWLVFEMVNGQKRRPIVVFNEADDYADTGDVVAIIKGKGPGGRSMFKPDEDLPAGYERLPTGVFRDRITGPQAFNRRAVIAPGEDRDTMLTHALMQHELRF